MKTFYGLMCVVGTIFPYGAFLPWLVDHGINIYLLLSEATQTRISTFAWLDVIASGIVLLAFIWQEGRKLGMRNLWLPTVGTCVIGVSLGLPLFLLLREIHIENQGNRAVDKQVS